MIDPMILTSAILALVVTPLMVPGDQAQGQRGAAPFQAPMPAQGAAAPEISGFSVVLVVGETQSSSGSGAVQELPAGAQRALSDMREFLPYKHYRVLDSQWTSCCSPRSRATVAGRLQGVAVGGTPGPQGPLNLVSRSYAFSITAGTSSPTITTRFILGIEETGRTANPERLRDLERERQDLQAEIEHLETQISTTRARIEMGTTTAAELPPLQLRHGALKRKLADVVTSIEELGSTGTGRPIIDSSFTMSAGETVVVGTSKLGGDKALIALVTAVKKNATSTTPARQP